MTQQASLPRILVVDDEPGMRQFLRTGLTPDGYVVSETDRGMGALDAVRRREIDLIVLGTHGKTGMDAFWAGSVAHRICSQSRVPLLLIPVGKS